MRITNFAIIPFSLFLTLGILVAKTKTTSFNFAVYGLICSWFLFIIFWIIARRQLVQNTYFGIMTYLIFFFIGLTIYHQNEPQNSNKHFSHFQVQKNYSLIDLRIAELLKSNNFYYNYIVDVVLIGDSSVTGKALLQISKDTTQLIDHSIDDRLLVSSQIIDIRPALNPKQFDLSKHMRTKGVYHQIKILPRDILQHKKGKGTLLGSAERMRSHVIDKMSSKSKGKDEFSIFKALVLGDRIEIERELYIQYINAGAVHILAVSGLHVGMIYLLMLIIFKPIYRIPYGRFLLPLLTIISLWSYAFITGLSESVIRSVTMFSLFAFTNIIRRRTNSINILFLSYFILMLISPFRLFRIGFQLSYLAVFFILWAQPMIYRLYRPRYYFDRMFWGIISVSIAAQAGILPLSLYYFHRFPGLFLITNSVVLPFLGLLLGGGVIVIILTLLNRIPEILSNTYWLIIEALNNFIGWVSAHDHFIIDNIHFSIEKTLFSYIFLISLLILWKVPSYRNTILSLSALMFLIGVYIIEIIENSKNELVIFHKIGQTSIGIFESGTFNLHYSESDPKSTFDHIIQPYLTSKNIKDHTEIELPKLFEYDRHLVYIPDSLSIYPKDNRIDWVILTNNPKINLERLIQETEPGLVIVDGNNWSSLAEHWKNTCEQYDIPFYITKEDGAFIYP